MINSIPFSIIIIQIKDQDFIDPNEVHRKISFFDFLNYSPIVISFLYTLIIINIKIIQKGVFYPQKPAKMTHNDENMMLVIFGVVGEADFVYKLLIVQLKIII